MAISTVKRKFPIFALALAAGVTAILSAARLFPASGVERIYARGVYPTLSHIAGLFADAVPFSWLDLWTAGTAVIVIICIRRRCWQLPLGMVCASYLLFFWGWGLNYHREPLEQRLGFDTTAPSPDAVDRLAKETAATLNRLWPVVRQDPEAVSHLAADRVRKVVLHIDGTDWRSASRIKHSYALNWWFRIAGIDGMFNPFGHEPILTSGAPQFQLPFLMAHELAHVHGTADEGEANFIAYVAGLESDNPEFQYSAAFEMWLHVGSLQLLDAGPRRDLETYIAYVHSREIPQAVRLQSAILDSHLKANGVTGGLRSYAKIVTLTIAARSRMEEFR